MKPDLNETDSCWVIERHEDEPNPGERAVDEPEVDETAPAVAVADDQPIILDDARDEPEGGCFGMAPRRAIRRRDRATTSRAARARGGRRRSAPRKED